MVASIGGRVATNEILVRLRLGHSPRKSLASKFPERTRRNPQTGQPIRIPARLRETSLMGINSPHFRCSSLLIEPPATNTLRH